MVTGFFPFNISPTIGLGANKDMDDEQWYSLVLSLCSVYVKEDAMNTP